MRLFETATFLFSVFTEAEKTHTHLQLENKLIRLILLLDFLTYNMMSLSSLKRHIPFWHLQILHVSVLSQEDFVTVELCIAVWLCSPAHYMPFPFTFFSNLLLICLSWSCAPWIFLVCSSRAGKLGAPYCKSKKRKNKMCHCGCLSRVQLCVFILSLSLSDVQSGSPDTLWWVV